jgi:hypothetical protein
MKTLAIHTNEMTLQPLFGRLANQTTHNLTGVASGSTGATTHDHKEVAMKTKHMILAVVAAALFSVLPHASAQQSDYAGIPTNLPGVTTAPAPPSGFNPLIASDSELAAYGFPPRPDKNALPNGYAAWKNALQAAKKRIFPELELTNRFNGPNAAAGKIGNTVYSYNWSGAVDTTTATSYGPNSFSFVQADFVAPVANEDPGQEGTFQCTGPVYSSSWVGIDGYGSNDVLQAGTEADVSCPGSVKTYDAWFEWFPNAETVIRNFPIAQGDDIQVLVWSTSATQGETFIVNYSTNEWVNVIFPAPSGTTLIGNSAEWVVERPEVNGSLATLTNYNWDYFSYGYATTVAGATRYPGDSGSIFVTMEKYPSNVPISAAQAMGVGNLWFTCLDQPTPCQ